MPFIARYRKEATGALDEVAITTIRDRLTQLAELDKRREAILKSIEEQGKLTDELKEKIAAAETLAELEDIYLPFRPKRRTRATIAREKGLEPLAQKLFEQGDMDPAAEAAGFVSEEKGVESVEAALAGARDIIAEWVNEDPNARARMRDLFMNQALLQSKVVEEKRTEALKFKDYFDWEEPIAAAPSHRVLAMRRGESEGFLILHIRPPEPEALALLEALFVKRRGAAAEQVRLAVQDSYKRLLSLSMETEIRLATKQRADEVAIAVFTDNLRHLLLAPPLGQKSVMGMDPGFRTGCKIVCLDRQGKLLDHAAIFPHEPQCQKAKAAEVVRRLCGEHQIEVIAIGNGTAGRETEEFVRSLDLPKEILVVMVNESGASVYSASEAAREEFPEQDITVRGAVSIGRRLMDPLAELVKIDPKAIGVGQYQHDVDQTRLKDSLDDVVVSCVNNVGVEVNTASKQLLTYVAGLGAALAGNVVAYRNQNGPFRSRQELRKVPRLGPKAFEQAAGFLRIRGLGKPAGRQRRPSRVLRHRGSHGVGPGLHGARPDARRGVAPENQVGEVCHRCHRSADPQRHSERTGQAGPRPAPEVRGLSFRRGRLQNRGPQAGNEAARDRDERRCLRRLCGRGRSPGRPGARQPNGRHLREEPRRGREGAAARHGDCPECGPGASADRTEHEARLKRRSAWS